MSGGSGDRSTVRVVRLSEIDDATWRLFDEYYEAIHVVERDTREGIQALIADPNSGVWVATSRGELAGCVVLRRLASLERAAECKRLYVRPQHRGHGVAKALLDTLEDFAEKAGFVWIYLDSYADLEAALALYRSRGYEACERYNENPQATVFLRKRIQ